VDLRINIVIIVYIISFQLQGARSALRAYEHGIWTWWKVLLFHCMAAGLSALPSSSSSSWCAWQPNPKP
jgi:hypothetical protein